MLSKLLELQKRGRLDPEILHHMLDGLVINGVGTYERGSLRVGDRVRSLPGVITSVGLPAPAASEPEPAASEPEPEARPLDFDL